MSKGSNRRPGEGYEDNYGKVFEEKPIERGSWVWDSAQGKLVPKGEYCRGESSSDAPAVLGDIDAFVSPVDGSIIDDRGKLREHNKRHGVTNVADYGPDYFERKGKEKYNQMTGRTREAKEARVDAIKRAMYDPTKGY